MVTNEVKPIRISSIEVKMGDRYYRVNDVVRPQDNCELKYGHTFCDCLIMYFRWVGDNLQELNIGLARPMAFMNLDLVGDNHRATTPLLTYERFEVPAKAVYDRWDFCRR